MKIAPLLSDNDWDCLQSYLQSMTPHTMSRSLGDITLTASIEPVSSPAWAVSMVIGIRVDYRHRVDMQWFESTQAARRAIERWRYG